jgi:3-carboxy-cis,cis-muconate cycloisomerase
MLEAVSDSAWVQAMLDVEAALARVEARLGVIPEAAAAAIAQSCRVEGFDIVQLGREAADSANPVVPLVAALRNKLSAEAAPFVHRGATSQDILDSGMMLVARRGLDLILDDLDQAAAAAAALADRHRSTLMAGRTLLQQALVTSFGIKAAGWLLAMVEARSALLTVRQQRLALQFGGAVGTLAALSDRGVEVMRVLAAELGLAEPVAPWHTNRTRIAELGSALALAAGVAGKVALDVILLAQTEVAEARQATTPGRGGSSTLPQKQNPVDAVEILAAVRGVNAQASLLQGAMLQEHERAAGAWQAEWPAVTEILQLTGGALSRLALLLSSLQIDPDRMWRNLDAAGGLIMSEQAVTSLANRVDLMTARKLVDAAVSSASATGRSLKDALLGDPAVTVHVTPEELAADLDPAAYLGVSNQFIDRALGTYRAAVPGGTQ